MLNIDLVKQGNEGELMMVGELSVNTAPGAEKIMLETVNRFDRVILNMERLTYVSSAGLRALKRANIQMRRKGGTLALKNVTKPVMEVLELTGFAVVFKII